MEVGRTHIGSCATSAALYWAVEEAVFRSRRWGAFVSRVRYESKAFRDLQISEMVERAA
jgi:hypothetical protein